jgi:hypothetical protein
LVSWRKDAGFRNAAQWIISPACALVGPTEERRRNGAMPELAISAEKVGFLIEKTRELER